MANEEYKYGIDDLADYMKITPEFARAKLRTAGIKKTAGGKYGWKTKAECQELGDTLNTPKKPKKETAPAKAAKPAKPAKPVAKKSAPKKAAPAKKEVSAEA